MMLLPDCPYAVHFLLTFNLLQAPAYISGAETPVKQSQSVVESQLYCTTAAQDWD